MRHWLFLFLVGLTSYGQILTLSSQDIERLAKLSQGEVTGLKTAIAQQVLTHHLLTGTSITFHFYIKRSSLRIEENKYRYLIHVHMNLLLQLLTYKEVQKIVYRI